MQQKNAKDDGSREYQIIKGKRAIKPFHSKLSVYVNLCKFYDIQRQRTKLGHQFLTIKIGLI